MPAARPDGAPLARRLIVAALAVAAVAAAVCLRERRGSRPLAHTFFPMGGIPLTIKVWDREEAAFARDLEAVRDLVDRLEAVLSRYRPESDISRINRARAGETVRVGGDAARVLDLAFRMGRATEGAFDAASGALYRLWREAEHVPSDAEIARVRAACGLEHFAFDAQARTVRKDADAAALDTGGIAKGYIVDRILEALRGRGIRRALVDCGGDLAGYGGDPPFRIGIRDPRKGPRDPAGWIPLAEGAVATSGSYERFREIDGVRFGHIVDPRPGRPVEGPLSATAVAPDGATADALATAFYVLGPEEGLRLARSLDGVEALFIKAGEEGVLRFHATEGLRFTAVR